MNEFEHQQISKPPSLALLFLSFLRLGATSFGGPAIVAYVGRLAVEKKKWLDEATFHDGVALCQGTPGSIAIKSAGYVGLKLRGLPGAAISYIAFALPAFALMMVLSSLYISFHSLPLVISAFNGLQIVIVAIVANATLSFGVITLRTYRDVIITVVAAITFSMGVHPVLVIVSAALLGLLLYKTISVHGDRSATLNKPYPVLRMALILGVSAIGFVNLFLLDRQLFDIAAVMSWINIFAFGGGYGAVPLMYHEIVDARSWMDSATLMNGIALGQVSPGPVVITATFVGYILRGPIGAIIATIGIFLPPFIILVAAEPYYNRLRFSPYFTRAIIGILCSFVGLLLSVTLRFSYDVHWEPVRIALATAAFLALLWKVDIFYVVLIGVVIAVLIL
jgi:chromate transporter